MAASLRCGVEAVGDCDWVIVTLGDQPRVTPQVIAAVMDHADSAPAGTAAVRATYDGVPGHPVALGRAILPHVAAAARRRGGPRPARRRHREDVRGRAPVRPGDVDTPEELEALRT